MSGLGSMSKLSASVPFYHVVAAIIWRPAADSSLLISKRQKGKHLEGLWELPGGKLELGETRIEGLRRELKEEIDIFCTDSEPFKQVRYEYENCSILLDVWEVHAFEGEVQAREGQEVRWINVDNIGKYQFPAADQPIIDAIANNAKAKKAHLL